jgi:hypothetical protein
VSRFNFRTCYVNASRHPVGKGTGTPTAIRDNISAAPHDG